MWKVLLIPVIGLFSAVLGSDPGPPILLVPGNGGNQLEAKLSEKWANRAGCPKTGEWFRLWLDVWLLMSKDSLSCFADMMKMHYDPVLGKSVNAEGVEVRVRGFGKTSTIEYLDPSWTAYAMGNVGSYFEHMISKLESWGYTRDVNIKAAPYDFRLAPGSLPQLQIGMRELVERMYRNNNNKKVVIIAHSAGGLVAHYFLNLQTQEWKDRHIQMLVSLGVPWQGAPLVFRTAVSGYNMDIPLLDSLAVRDEQRSSEVNILLLPKSPAWSQDHVFVSSPWKNYTLRNKEELINDVGYADGKQLLALTTGPEYNFDPPGVDVHCWYGTGVDTQDSYVYGEGFPDVEPSIIHTIDGDGIVPAKSAKACEMWNNEVPRHHSVQTKSFNNLVHLQLVKHTAIFEELKKVLWE